VITGAESVIGRALALELTRRAPGWSCRTSTATLCVGRLKRAAERGLSRWRTAGNRALRCGGLVDCSWRHHSGDRNERFVAE
jgi:hypothetical protein